MKFYAAENDLAWGTMLLERNAPGERGEGPGTSPQVSGFGGRLWLRIRRTPCTTKLSTPSLDGSPITSICPAPTTRTRTAASRHLGAVPWIVVASQPDHRGATEPRRRRRSRGRRARSC